MRCFSGEIPIPVSVTSNASTFAARSSTGWVPLQPPRAGDTEGSPSLLGELHRVRQQVLEHLLQPLRIGNDGIRQRLVDDTSNSRRFPSDSWRNGRAMPSMRLVSTTSSAMTVTVPDSILEVEDVGDEVERVGAGAVNGAGELALLR